jgi:hypothetical protein
MSGQGDGRGTEIGRIAIHAVKWSAARRPSAQAESRAPLLRLEARSRPGLVR